AEAERPSIRAAVIEEMTLIAIDDGLGDLARLGDRPLGAPGEEAVKMPLPFVDRVRGVVTRALRIEEGGDACGRAVRIAQLADRRLRLLVAATPAHQPFRRYDRTSGEAAGCAFSADSPRMTSEAASALTLRPCEGVCEVVRAEMRGVCEVGARLASE